METLLHFFHMSLYWLDAAVDLHMRLIVVEKEGKLPECIATKLEVQLLVQFHTIIMVKPTNSLSNS